jgi:transposase
MFIDVVPNRSSPPAVLLRESSRENGKVTKRTIANLSDWPEEKIEALRVVLKSDGKVDVVKRGGFTGLTITRSLPHGHVVATLGAMTRLKFQDLLGLNPETSKRVFALIASRILDPQPKLAIARALSEESTQWSLGRILELPEHTSSDDLYDAMDALVARQGSIEKTLAKRHLSDGSLLLYDLTSTYFEGHTCPLATYGHSRDGKRGLLQITVGLLCNREGCPIAVEVFPGNTGDPTSFTAQVAKIRERFGLSQVIMVGDRGMITSARIREDLRGVPGMAWITALRNADIRALRDQGAIQLGIFDTTNLAEISSSAFPDERLIVCRNPLLAAERTRKRNELLDTTQARLEDVQRKVTRAEKPLKGQVAIARAVEKAFGRHKMEKHFIVTIEDESFAWKRNDEKIAKEAELDGFYVIRTSVPLEQLPANEAVAAYKDLATVERAFRTMKGLDLKIRPIHHVREDRVRSHVFLCMLAYYVEYHMRQWLAPILFHDDDRESAAAERADIVTPALRSEKAHQKDASKRTANGAPVHSFHTLLKDLATISLNTLTSTPDVPAFTLVTRPTTVQEQAFALLKVPTP